MILDTFSNRGLYTGLGYTIAHILQFLSNGINQLLPEGRHDFVPGAYFMLSRYDTKPFNPRQWEAHNQFIDIHYMLEGAEQMGYAPRRTLTQIKEYDSEKDVLMLSGQNDFFTLENDRFAIFFPADAHQPGLFIPPMSQSNVQKIVFKISFLSFCLAQDELRKFNEFADKIRK